MVKQNKMLFVLGGVLLALIAVMVGLLVYKPAQPSKASSETATRFTSYESVDDIVLVHVQNKSGEYTIANGGGGKFAMQDVDSDMLNTEAISSLFSGLQQIISSSTVKKDVTEEELAQYGLDDPAATVLLMDNQEGGIEMKFGALSPDQVGRYLYITGVPNVYTMAEEKAQTYLADRSAYLDLRFYPSMEGENIKAIASFELTDAQGGGYRLERTRASDITNLVYFDMVSPVHITTSRQNVETQLLTPLQNLRGEKLVSTDAADYVTYGLDQPDYTIHMNYQDQDYTLLFAQKDGVMYGTTDGTGRIFTVSGDQTKFLSKTYMDIIGNSVFDQNITTISNITLDIRGEHFSYDISGEGDGLTAMENGEVKDISVFMDLFSALGNIYIEGETGAVSGEPEFTMVVSYREEGAPQDVFEITPVDDRKGAVAVNGHTAFYTYRTNIDNILKLAQQTSESTAAQ